MRTLPFSIPLAFVAGLILSLSSVPSRAESKPSPQLAPPNGPKSEFVFRPGYAKDPFFPRSTDNMIAPPVTITPGDVPQNQVPGYIVLKGISIVNGRKLCIINNYTVGEGEEFALKRAGGAPITVRCIEVKDKSVVISVDGVTKELTLRVN